MCFPSPLRSIGWFWWTRLTWSRASCLCLTCCRPWSSHLQVLMLFCPSIRGRGPSSLLIGLNPEGVLRQVRSPASHAPLLSSVFKTVFFVAKSYIRCELILRFQMLIRLVYIVLFGVVLFFLN